MRRVIPTLQREGIESVAVGLIHSYANPAHEERVAAILAEALPDVAISLSSSRYVRKSASTSASPPPAPMPMCSHL